MKFGTIRLSGMPARKVNVLHPGTRYRHVYLARAPCIHSIDMKLTGFVELVQTRRPRKFCTNRSGGLPARKVNVFHPGSRYWHVYLARARTTDAICTTLCMFVENI